MNKEQQNLSWKCLPKEAREKLKRAYKYQCHNSDYNRGFNEALEEVFNSHNLASDTEPEELIFAPKWRVEQYLKGLDVCIDISDLEQVKALRNALGILFGDKCLPDKELEHGLEQTVQESVQVEPTPKFKVGDRVSIKYYVKQKTTYIKQVYVTSYGYIYETEEGRFHENWLESYTEEPETRSKEAKETQNLSLSDEQSTENKEPMEEKELGKEDNFPTKELNLCELLKGCEKNKCYSPMLGDAFIVQIRETSIHIVPCDEEHCERFLFIDKCGIWTKGGQCILYPSRALYEKYPLDAYSAWMEWARKPKRWRAKEGEQYFLLNPDGEVMVDNECYFDIDSYRHDFGNYFRTQEEAQQASEVVKEALVKFHEQNVEK